MSVYSSFKLDSISWLVSFSRLGPNEELYKECNDSNHPANNDYYHYDCQLSEDEWLVASHGRIRYWNGWIHDIIFHLVQNPCISQPHNCIPKFQLCDTSFIKIDSLLYYTVLLSTCRRLPLGVTQLINWDIITSVPKWYILRNIAFTSKLQVPTAVPLSILKWYYLIIWCIILCSFALHFSCPFWHTIFIKGNQYTSVVYTPHRRSCIRRDVLLVWRTLPKH